MAKIKKPETEAEALADLEKWVRMCLQDTKLYVGLRDAIEDLDHVRAKKR